MKKKIVQINVVCNGSTGKIMCDIAKELDNIGYETYCFFGRGKSIPNLNCIKFTTNLSVYLHLFLARLGFNGHGSYFATKKLIKKLKKINPDVIHLHNIHGYYINLKVLFNYLKNDYHGKIIWTLHDCWAFTGHCAYFTLVGCDKWKKKCHNCPQLSSYPKQLFDTTKREYLFKKELFSNINNLTLITPSMWLKKLVEKSFLKQYETKVIYNGIDLNIFKPTYDEKIYNKYHIPKNKKIILGVASVWEKRKGLDIFLEMSKLIKENEIIVLVGLNQKQIKRLPNNIIGIKRTENSNELAAIYTMANVFVNPSKEETFSLVTVEAMACGTNVVVCDASAPKELVRKNDIIVSGNNVIEYYDAIKKIINQTMTNDDFSILKFQNKNMMNNYNKLYKEE